MVRFVFANLVVAAAAFIQKESFFAGAIDRSDCEPIDKLGPDNVDQFDFSVSLDVDDACSYTLSYQMKHDPSLPVPSEASQCDPTIVPPAIASDGLPYFAGRTAYDSFPEYIKKSTGIDHISIDYQPCGHPPLNVFTVPHYDFHIYLVDTEYRSCMTCKKVPGAPVCDPTDQTTPSGYGFLNVNTIAVGPDTGKIANMPDGFVVDGEALVPMMGGHAWNVANQPDAGNPFADPVWVMGTYDGRTVFYEPMIPLAFLVGDESKEYEESLTYVGQSVGELPAKYSASYDATAGYLTVTLSGKSAVCGKSAKNTKKDKKKKRRQL